MRLASDNIVLRIGGEAVTLRQSLRAALRLSRKYGSFAEIVRMIADGNLTVMADVIAESTHLGTPLADVLPTLTGRPLAMTLSAIQTKLIAHVVALAGADDPDTQEPGRSSNSISFAAYFEQLFATATGVIGWTPDEAWNATPAEIVAAYKGRIELLQTIFGNGDAKPAKSHSLDDKARLAFASIGTKKVQAA